MLTKLHISKSEHAQWAAGRYSGDSTDMTDVFPDCDNPIEFLIYPRNMHYQMASSQQPRRQQQYRPKMKHDLV